MSVSQEFSRFNIYDVFSNFLPSSMLLLGLVLPLSGSVEYIGEIGIGGIVIWATVSFSFGLLIQSVGGYVISGSKEFEARMLDIHDENGQQIGRSAVNEMFLRGVYDQFGLTSEIDDWNPVYRYVLTQLEQNPASRALRLQALFLALRGLFVANCLLVISFITYSILDYFSHIRTSASPKWLLAFATVGLVVAIILRARVKEFNEDAITYMMLEFGQVDE